MAASYLPVDNAITDVNSSIQETSSFIEQLSTVDDKTVVRVLLVDDQPIVAESIRRLLASEPDIQLYYCDNAQKAIPMATQIQPTVILQDLVMPDADGLMLLKFFRANPTTSTIPVIVLSTRDEPVVKAEAFAIGANDYLVKVPDPIEFIARLKYHSTAYANLLKRHEAERVRAYNKELEERVADRTNELEIALMELKQAQTRVIQEEKMAGVGQLVSGICHELNNPVSFIQGNLEPARTIVTNYFSWWPSTSRPILTHQKKIQSAIEHMDLDFITQDFRKLLNSLKSGAERISDIVLSLRNFSRLDEVEIKSVNVHEGIDHALLILGSRLQEIEVIKDYDLHVSVECLPGHLNQVFMHILTNAVDALQEKSHEQDQHPNNSLSNEPPQIHIQTQLIDGDYALISFTDNGPGISQKVMNRIFEPFFTTKPVGQGTGLGLSLSYQSITEYHGGGLECRSTLGQSTTFIITIPIHQAKDASVLFGKTRLR